MAGIDNGREDFPPLFRFFFDGHFRLRMWTLQAHLVFFPWPTREHTPLACTFRVEKDLRSALSPFSSSARWLITSMDGRTFLFPPTPVGGRHSLLISFLIPLVPPFFPSFPVGVIFWSTSPFVLPSSPGPIDRLITMFFALSTSRPSSLLLFPFVVFLR